MNYNKEAVVLQWGWRREQTSSPHPAAAHVSAGKGGCEQKTHPHTALRVFHSHVTGIRQKWMKIALAPPL